MGGGAEGTPPYSHEFPYLSPNASIRSSATPPPQIVNFSHWLMNKASHICLLLTISCADDYMFTERKSMKSRRRSFIGGRWPCPFQGQSRGQGRPQWDSCVRIDDFKVVDRGVARWRHSHVPRRRRWRHRRVRPLVVWCRCRQSSPQRGQIQNVKILRHLTRQSRAQNILPIIAGFVQLISHIDISVRMRKLNGNDL